MNKKTKIFVVVLAVTGGSLTFYFWNTPALNVMQTDSETATTTQKFDSRIDDQANVTVTVTPIQLSRNSDEWKFNVVMDTHSVELDQNMINIVVLIDDQGTRYSPLNWEGSSGGHHREGVLTFQGIVTSTKFIELKISGIGDVTRDFTWQLD